MESRNSVEWELVDYGSGVFHIASYHDNGVATAPASETVPEKVVVGEADPARDCVLYRCWVALRDGCRAA